MPPPAALVLARRVDAREALLATPGLTHAELAARLGVDRSTATRIVAELVETGEVPPRVDTPPVYGAGGGATRHRIPDCDAARLMDLTGADTLREAVVLAAELIESRG